MYETVDLKKLSENKFNDFVMKFDFNQMTATMWKNFSECFFATRTGKNASVKENEIKIEYDGNSSNRFKGIINHLQQVKHLEIVTILLFHHLNSLEH